MTDIEREYGFDLSGCLCCKDDENWSNRNNKADTHGYSKTMNQPRFKKVSNTADLGFSSADKKTSLEALDFDLESVIDSIEEM
jgi:hypothetical protein